MDSVKYCPLCGMNGITFRTKDDIYYITCSCQELIRPNSIYKMCEIAYDDYFDQSANFAKYNFRSVRRNDKEKLMLLRYYHSKAQQTNPEGSIIDTDFIKMIEKQNLPTILEQLDNLIVWCGKYGNEHSNIIGSFISHGHIIGSSNNAMFDSVINEARKREYLRGNSLNLDFNGQLKYEELSRGIPKGYEAFMAMKFGDIKLDEVFEHCFIPAVKATGFSLKKLDDEPKAGLIDNRLRQKLRLARFIIADLTHSNNGAYWEAGYAEGLGKPVIYTCEKQIFDSVDPQKKPHFDANHHQTIIWDKENLKDAENKLKATIRCTIPEAIQKDEE